MAIVKTYYFDGNPVYIDDTYIVKTEAERQKILDEMGRIYTNALIKQAMEKQNSKKNNTEQRQKETKKSVE